MQFTCIRCPLGCTLSVNKKGGEWVVTGNTCPRGAEYGKEEVTCPKRTVTSLIKTTKGVIPVKTDKPVPKDKIFAVLDEISKFPIVTQKCKIGDIVIQNVCHTDANIVVTGTN